METITSTAGARPKESYLNRQFGHPSGVFGSLVGLGMALEHRQLHEAVVQKLHLEPVDRVLEVGFGPGTAIRLAAKEASFTAGIDPSQEMVRQALRRNRGEVKSGRVQIRCASASQIPFEDGAFTVVFEVNSFHHWDNSEAGLKEVHRVLRPGGRLLMVLNGPHGQSVQKEAERVVRLVAAAGFHQAAAEKNHFGHGGAFVTAVR